MKPRLQVLLGLCCILSGVAAEENLAITSTVKSASGQFVIYGTSLSDTRPGAPKFGANTNVVRLEPAVLAVSCERIKQALLRELGATDQWRGKIHLVVRTGQGPESGITVTASKFSGGWSYRMDLPEFVEPVRLVRGMVRLLLLEWANRYEGGHSAEVPTWLSEGLSEKMVNSSPVELVVQPATPGAKGMLPTPVMQEKRKTNPVARFSEQTRALPVLTIEELSWPGEELFAEGEPAEAYRHSAELFVSELLRLRTGRACMQAFIRALPYSLNWQTAFFQAFGAYFQDPSDLEKWWALQVVNLTGHGPGTVWSQQDACERLQDLLQVPVQVGLASNNLPLETKVPIQTILLKWDYASQRQILQNVIMQLRALGLQADQQVKVLAEQYYLTLQNYMEQLAKRGSARSPKRPPAVRRMIEQTVSRLNELDARLGALRAAAEIEAPPQHSNTGTP